MPSMFLSEVVMLLGANFLGDFGRRLITRTLVSFLALVGCSLGISFIGLSLGTYTLIRLERHKKQTNVHGSHIPFP